MTEFQNGLGGKGPYSPSSSSPWNYPSLSNPALGTPRGWGSPSCSGQAKNSFEFPPKSCSAPPAVAGTSGRGVSRPRLPEEPLGWILLLSHQQEGKQHLAHPPAQVTPGNGPLSPASLLSSWDNPVPISFGGFEN